MAAIWHGRSISRWRYGWLALLLLSLSHPLSAKQVLFAAMDDWPPFIIAKHSVASNSGFDGIDWELLQELTARTGIEIYPIPYPFARGLKEVEAGRIDLITSVVKTAERSKYMGFLQTPYYHCQTAFYAQPEMASQIKSYADLYGKRIGYTLGSAYFEPFDSDRKLLKKATINENKLPMMLLKRNEQLFIGTDCQVDYALKVQGLTGQIVPTLYRPNQGVELYIGYSKAAGIAPEVARLEKALKEMVDEGWVDKLADSYFQQPN